MVHQELAFCENLTVAENLCLGALPAQRTVPVARARCGGAPSGCWRRSAPRIDVRPRVGELTTGQQQMLQIAAAVGSGARVIVFDEPTSSLSQHEARHALRADRRGCASSGVTIHLRQPPDGGDLPAVRRRHGAARRPPRRRPAGRASSTEAALVQMMIGRPLDEYFPAHVAGRAGRGAAARRGPVEPRPVPGHLVHAARRRSAGPRRAGRRGTIGDRAGAVRPRSATSTGRIVGARAGRSRLATPARRCAPASAWCPRIASGRAWCCR